ncbi:MAG: DJ-1/PfpI family protein [Sneathiellales bacterium]|nr:DJ-1/PfpI family protein [Sneathiellales bacterium]
MREIAVVLFPGFELLDVFGPLEMFGINPEAFSITLVAETVGAVASNQGPKSWVETRLEDRDDYDMILVPGGRGTRTQVGNEPLLNWLKSASEKAEITTSVCTGAGLLAKAGLLDGRKATTNKISFDWVQSQSDQVHWVKEARWVEDGAFWTSSGVSAGIDMSLALIEHLVSEEVATQTALYSEYERHADAGWDPFAKIHGLV